MSNKEQQPLLECLVSLLDFILETESEDQDMYVAVISHTMDTISKEKDITTIGETDEEFEEFEALYNGLILLKDFIGLCKSDDQSFFEDTIDEAMYQIFGDAMISESPTTPLDSLPNELMEIKEYLETLSDIIPEEINNRFISILERSTDVIGYVIRSIREPKIEEEPESEDIDFTDGIDINSN